jgi:predicted tellurium resistance membrane protein TerC
MDWLMDPQAWIAFATLLALEIVLGIDNVVFISILAAKLPASQQAKARLLGLGLAMVMRIVLLLSISWVIGLTAPLFTIFRQEISGRDLVLIIGGLFLIAKSTHEIHQKLEGEEGRSSSYVPPTFASVIVQILLLDVVFSLDSVITAVGMVDQIGITVSAVVIAVVFMMMFAGSDRPLRRAPPDSEDVGAELFAAYRYDSDWRRLGPTYSKGLHLLRDGLFRFCRNAQP